MVVSNSFGAVTSQVATLTVLAPPSISDEGQPVSQLVDCGGNVDFTVAPDDARAMAYQWYFGASPLAGQIAPTLSLTNIIPIQGGNYSVVISNLAGTATSAVAVLTVHTLDLHLTCPASILTNIAGSSVAVSFAPTPSDNCGVSVVCVPPSGSTFTLGTNIVSCTATDGVSRLDQCSFTIQVQQCQVTGLVAMEFYTGPAHDGNGTRAVTFTISHVEAGVTNYLGTRTNTLTFAPGADGYGVASFVLTNVPLTATHVSAKTAWSLRKRLPLTFSGNVAPANFTGSNALLGGDLDNSNGVDLADYYQMAFAWYTAQPAEDIDGNGVVDMDDYFILANHFNQTGDPE